MAPSCGCALDLQKAMEEEEKKVFDGCQQNEGHCPRHREPVWAVLRRVAHDLHPYPAGGASGRRGAESWTRSQAR